MSVPDRRLNEEVLDAVATNLLIAPYSTLQLPTLVSENSSQGYPRRLIWMVILFTRLPVVPFNDPRFEHGLECPSRATFKGHPDTLPNSLSNRLTPKRSQAPSYRPIALSFHPLLVQPLRELFILNFAKGSQTGLWDEPRYSWVKIDHFARRPRWLRKPVNYVPC